MRLSLLRVQFDTLLGDLTVREMLTYTAELKRPTSEPLADKKREASGGCLGLQRCRTPAAAARPVPQSGGM